MRQHHFTEEQSSSDTMPTKTYPKQTIYYGPPGTGKTYNTISKSLEICGYPTTGKSSSELQVEFQRRIKEGQIVFTTFHQSLSYEDFVEGIRPKTTNSDGESVDDGEKGRDIVYQVEPGIFRQICEKARKGISVARKFTWSNNVNIFKMSLGGKKDQETHSYCLEEEVIALGWGGSSDLSSLSQQNYTEEFRTKFASLYEQNQFHEKFSRAFIHKLQVGDIVFISKGNHEIDAIGRVIGDYEYDPSRDIGYVHFRKVEWLAKDIGCHPDIFLDVCVSQMTIYQFKDKDIKHDELNAFFLKNNRSNLTTPNHVLIIDEINRGNVSAIFGELITLLEENKREDSTEALSVRLPYSRDNFSVPSNLYILGTMNTADRSVEALDTALRRRFHFKEFLPNPSVLKAHCKPVDGIHLDLLLKKINERIEHLIDRDHTIGHSYFLTVKTMSDLQRVFQNQVIPLLQEYFYSDYGKVGLILGSGFVESIPPKRNIFAHISGIDGSDFAQSTYRLKKISTDVEFKAAINTLLGTQKEQ